MADVEAAQSSSQLLLYEGCAAAATVDLCTVICICVHTRARTCDHKTEHPVDTYRAWPEPDLQTWAVD
jgi:hypothetical protein